MLGHFAEIILVAQIHKKFFRPVTLPRETALSYFAYLFYYYFWMLLYFLRTIKLLDIIFHRCFWYYSGIYFTILNLFTVSPPLLKDILVYFGAHFGLCLSIIGNGSPFYLMKFCTDAFHIILTVSTLIYIFIFL